MPAGACAPLLVVPSHVMRASDLAGASENSSIHLRVIAEVPAGTAACMDWNHRRARAFSLARRFPQARMRW